MTEDDRTRLRELAVECAEGGFTAKKLKGILREMDDLRLLYPEEFEAHFSAVYDAAANALNDS